jgi:nucleotide-binding universal stress UspA family protein
VAQAIELADTSGAELVALNVVARYPMSYFEGAIAAQASEVQRIEAQWLEHGKVLVEAVRSAAQAQGVKTKGVVARSDLVAEAIISTAKKHKCDLIVMASHGRRGLKRLLLGSETQHVLTHTNIAVLVLR